MRPIHNHCTATVAELSQLSQIHPALLEPGSRSRCCCWWDPITSRGVHLHPLHAPLLLLLLALLLSPLRQSELRPALAASPSLWSPRCHFCARVPFTLSVRMCDMKPPLQTIAACDQTVRRGRFYFEGEMLSLRGRAVKEQLHG